MRTLIYDFNLKAFLEKWKDKLERGFESCGKLLIIDVINKEDGKIWYAQELFKEDEKNLPSEYEKTEKENIQIDENGNIY